MKTRRFVKGYIKNKRTIKKYRKARNIKHTRKYQKTKFKRNHRKTVKIGGDEEGIENPFINNPPIFHKFGFPSYKAVNKNKLPENPYQTIYEEDVGIKSIQFEELPPEEPEAPEMGGAGLGRAKR